MNKSGFSYLKLTAVVAVLAMTLIGLGGLLSMTTNAQEKRTAPTREIDVRAKVKDKKFADGRRVEILTLDSGGKIVAEIKEGKFLNWFLVTADGTEIKGEVKFRHSTTTTTTTVTCSATIVNSVETTDPKSGKKIITSTTHIIQIPCPADNPHL